MKHPIVLFLFLLYVNSAFSKTMTVSTLTEDYGLVPYVSAVMKVAYSKLGFKITIKKFPSERSLMLSNRGDVDAELIRASIIDKKYINLVKVKVPIVVSRGVVIAKDEHSNIASLESLEGKKVCIMRGIKYFEKHAAFLKPQKYDGMRGLLKAVKRNMCTFAVAEKLISAAVIKKSFKNSGIRIVLTLPNNEPLYHYVHKRNKSLVPKLENVLKSMNDSGQLAEIIDGVTK